MEKQRKIWLLTPMFGIILFVVLYFIATIFYPGGSQADKNSSGFSWINNYWCNLLNNKAINGLTNTAQPIALTAMFILCLTLIYFWVDFPKYTNLKKSYQFTIQISGTFAMIISFFLFTEFDHDLIINLSSFFGLFATTGTFIALYKNNWKTLFYFGLINILLVILNNILYHNISLILYLPLVQKFTFATFLIWICCINLKIYKLVKEK